MPALVARAIKLVDGLARTRRETVENSQIASSTPSPTRLARFVISPSTMGVFIHYRVRARLLLRLAKRNVGLDYRVRATARVPRLDGDEGLRQRRRDHRGRER